MPEVYFNRTSEPHRWSVGWSAQWHLLLRQKILSDEEEEKQAVLKIIKKN